MRKRKRRKSKKHVRAKCPSQVKELLNFENDLIDLVKNVKFDENYRRSEFQNKLKMDIHTITRSEKTLTAADKNLEYL